MILGEKNTLKGEALREVLEKVCNGLVYVSESDAEIRAILVERGGSLSLEGFIKRSSSSDMIETRPAADFFAGLTADRPWHGDTQRERVGQFRELARIFFDNTREQRMFRVGKIRVEIFVVGYDSKGNIAGIRTEAVET